MRFTCSFGSGDLPSGSAAALMVRRISNKQRINVQKCKQLLGQSARLNFNSVQAVCKAFGIEVPCLRECIKKDLDLHTPVGPLIVQVPLTLPGTKWRKTQIIKWSVANPLALLYVACTSSSQFSKFLKLWLVDSKNSLLLYSDEVIPGNVLRPDGRRKAQCIYASFRGLPYWFRSRNCAWLPIGVLKSWKVKAIPGGMSMLSKKVFNICYGELFSFRLGVRLPLGSSGETWCLRCDFCGWIQDLEAHRDVSDTKGSAGSKCCLWCRNITKGVKDLAPDDYFKDYRTAEPDSFDLYTEATFQAMVDLVERSKDQPNFKEVQQAAGIVYNPDGLIFAKPPLVNYPRDAVPDWVHVLVCAGGTLQVVLNSFAEAVVHCKEL